jgi:O-antigen ligase/Tfp pilus assembly protein PilF
LPAAPDAQSSQRRRLVVLALATLFFGPLTGGATGSWPLTILVAGCLLLLVLTLFGLKGPLLRPPGWLPLLLLLGFVLLQLIPLPPALLTLLSPATAQRYTEGVWLIKPDLWLPLSVHPKATLAAFLRLSASAAFYFATIQLLSRFRTLRFATSVLTIFGGIFALLGLVQFIFPSDRVFWFFVEWPDRTAHHFATYVNGNHYAGLIGMLLPLALAMVVYRLPRRLYSGWREGVVEFFSNPDTATFAGFLAATVVMGASVFFSLSRGGVLASLAALLIFFVILVCLGIERRRILLPGFVLLMILGTVGWVGWEPVFERFESVRTESGELNTKRLDYWQDSLESIKVYPLFGTGAGTFADAYPRFQTETTRKLVDHAHNDYVEWLLEGGLVGAVLAAWFLLDVVFRSFRFRRRRGHLFSSYLWLGSMAGLVSILLHSITDFNLQIPANGLMLSALLALLVAAAHTRSRSGGPSSDLPGIPTQMVRCVVRPVALLMLLAGLGVGFAGAIADSRLQLLEALDVEAMGDDQKRASTLEKLTGAASLDPWSARHKYALGQVAWFGEKDRGRAFFAEALQRNPVSSLYANALAKAILGNGDKAHVTELLAAAAANDRAEPGYWKDLGSWYLRVDQHEEALQAFRQVIALRPLQTRDFLTFMILKGLTDAELEEAIPDHPEAHLQIAGYLRGVGRFPRAEAHLEAAMQLAEQPVRRNPRVFGRVSQYYLNNDKTARAFLVLKRGIKAYPDSVDLLLRLARLSEREHLTVQAIDYYRRLSLLEPGNRIALERLQSLGDGLR